MSKDSFKAFVSKKPELAEYVKDNTMTWQKFYEIYDIYGENEEIWNKYTTTRQTNKISELIKKFDPESFEKHIKTAQKALDIFSELAIKKEPIADEIPSIERPINKFFGD
jgi:hypothetical protein